MHGLNRHSSSSLCVADLNRNGPFTTLRSTPVPISRAEIDGKEDCRVLTCQQPVLSSISRYTGTPVAMGGTAIPLFCLRRSNTIENRDLDRRMSE